ncbi:hypothetical protein OC861_006215 [Tilletia horrida]|nr:hypothetical protein OC861_006215 [Tilletia horrida]
MTATDQGAEEGVADSGGGRTKAEDRDSIATPETADVEENASVQEARPARGVHMRYEEEDEGKYPTPRNDNGFIHAVRVRYICDYLQVMQAKEFVCAMAQKKSYVGSADLPARLTDATLDDRGRFMVKVTVTIEATPTSSNMRRKRTVEGDREYLCNVFSNAQAPPSWTMSCSLPPVNAEADKHLRAAIIAFSTRIKVLKAAALSASWSWVEPTLGGSAMWPKLERSLFVKAGEELDPGRRSDSTCDHDLLRLVEDQGLRYNHIPEVTVDDAANHDIWNVDWHAAHDIITTACWEVHFFVRVYASTQRKKIGFALAIDYPIAPGKLPAPSSISPVPAKRTVDYFTGYEQFFKRSRSTGSETA